MAKSTKTSLQSLDTDVSSWEDIYLYEDRYNKPKEMFKHIDSLVTAKRISGSTRWLDIGCATGEFLFYLEKKHPIVSCTGIDISKPMIEKAIEPSRNSLILQTPTYLSFFFFDSFNCFSNIKPKRADKSEAA